MLISASIVTTIVNLSLGKYGGDMAIGAFGIINSIAGLAVMVVIGFNQGMQPIVGYNYGAKKIERVTRVFRLTVFAGIVVTSLGFVLAEIFPRQIAAAFTSSMELIDHASLGMRLNLLMFPIVGFQIVTSSFFQSIGKASISIFLSLSRQVLFLIPALFILPHFLGLSGVWLSGPAADFLSSLITLMILQWQVRKIKLALSTRSL